jgi:hypothetical protein
MHREQQRLKDMDLVDQSSFKGSYQFGCKVRILGGRERG